MITIKLNDKTYTIEENTSLATFINFLEIKKQGIAIAIHYEVAPKDKWDEIILTEGMELMLIHAVSGG